MQYTFCHYNQTVVCTVFLLHLVGVFDHKHKYPSQLSGGQRQRVAIARALVSEPPMVLADEPTANLDSTSATQLIELFRELNRERGITFVIATHDTRVMAYCPRLIRMEDGKIISDEAQSGRPGEPLATGQ